MTIETSKEIDISGEHASLNEKIVVDYGNSYWSFGGLMRDDNRCIFDINKRKRACRFAKKKIEEFGLSGYANISVTNDLNISNQEQIFSNVENTYQPGVKKDELTRWILFFLNWF